MRGKDEKDIVIDHDTPGFIEQLLNLRNRPKWRDMHSNAERTRFLYIKFMVHLCKKGYKLFASDTSREISLVAPNYTNNKKEEVSLLFDNYELARYNSIDPDDATIELLKHIN
ncbi:hypothetical protein SDC9_157062 [bioreactor metagenome]|uniref:Uncharacterized protein n=1 Tax=bioreactor metagenome TaxID=1076179 RepID=A0A645F7A8_9ZZZZ